MNSEIEQLIAKMSQTTFKGQSDIKLHSVKCPMDLCQMEQPENPIFNPTRPQYEPVTDYIDGPLEEFPPEWEKWTSELRSLSMSEEKTELMEF